jgi:hypothetical protein
VDEPEPEYEPEYGNGAGPEIENEDATTCLGIGLSTPGVGLSRDRRGWR